jgi:hypothetical protein
MPDCEGMVDAVDKAVTEILWQNALGPIRRHHPIGCAAHESAQPIG